MRPDPRVITTWVLALSVPVAAAALLTAFLREIPYDLLVGVVKTNFAAIIGLPLAAIFCMFLVVVMQQTSGPVKFEALGLKFEGTSGQVVLWVFCFSAVAGAIKLLWVNAK